MVVQKSISFIVFFLEFWLLKNFQHLSPKQEVSVYTRLIVKVLYERK